MPQDTLAELAAMSEIADTLKKLDPGAIKRVITWAADHYGLSVPLGGTPMGAASGTAGAQAGGATAEIADVADLCDAAKPKTGPERALVVGYWLQKIQGEKDFDGFTVNSALKNMGQKSANITVAFNALKDRKPSLAMQVKKGGTAKQARKRYKLTTEGIRKVERMLGGDDGQEDK